MCHGRGCGMNMPFTLHHLQSDFLVLLVVFYKTGFYQRELKPAIFVICPKPLQSLLVLTTWPFVPWVCYKEIFGRWLSLEISLGSTLHFETLWMWCLGHISFTCKQVTSWLNNLLIEGYNTPPWHLFPYLITAAAIATALHYKCNSYPSLLKDYLLVYQVLNTTDVCELNIADSWD